MKKTFILAIFSLFFGAVITFIPTHVRAAEVSAASQQVNPKVQRQALEAILEFERIVEKLLDDEKRPKNWEADSKKPAEQCIEVLPIKLSDKAETYLVKGKVPLFMEKGKPKYWIVQRNFGKIRIIAILLDADKIEYGEVDKSGYKEFTVTNFMGNGGITIRFAFEGDPVNGVYHVGQGIFF